MNHEFELQDAEKTLPISELAFPLPKDWRQANNFFEGIESCAVQTQHGSAVLLWKRPFCLKGKRRPFVPYKAIGAVYSNGRAGPAAAASQCDVMEYGADWESHSWARINDAGTGKWPGLLQLQPNELTFQDAPRLPEFKNRRSREMKSLILSEGGEEHQFGWPELLFDIVENSPEILEAVQDDSVAGSLYRLLGDHLIRTSDGKSLYVESQGTGAEFMSQLRRVGDRGEQFKPSRYINNLATLENIEFIRRELARIGYVERFKSDLGPQNCGCW